MLRNYSLTHLLRMAYSSRLTMHCQWGWLSSFSFFVPGDPNLWTFDLDIHTRPSEGPNTSSLWIWRKSIQQFPTYFIHKQKKVTDSTKNRTLHSSLHVVTSLRLCYGSIALRISFENTTVIYWNGSETLQAMSISRTTLLRRTLASSP